MFFVNMFTPHLPVKINAELNEKTEDDAQSLLKKVELFVSESTSFLMVFQRWPCTILNGEGNGRGYVERIFVVCIIQNSLLLISTYGQILTST